MVGSTNHQKQRTGFARGYALRRGRNEGDGEVVQEGPLLRPLHTLPISPRCLYTSLYLPHRKLVLPSLFSHYTPGYFGVRKYNERVTSRRLVSLSLFIYWCCGRYARNVSRPACSSYCCCCCYCWRITSPTTITRRFSRPGREIARMHTYIHIHTQHTWNSFGTTGRHSGLLYHRYSILSTDCVCLL